jgi:hypothetical protein
MRYSGSPAVDAAEVRGGVFGEVADLMQFSLRRLFACVTATVLVAAAFRLLSIIPPLVIWQTLSLAGSLMGCAVGARTAGSVLMRIRAAISFVACTTTIATYAFLTAIYWQNPTSDVRPLMFLAAPATVMAIILAVRNWNLSAGDCRDDHGQARA